MLQRRLTLADRVVYTAIALVLLVWLFGIEAGR